MAYGQTGSGKTHTMFGPPGHVQSLAFGMGPNTDSGVIPRAIMQIFNLAADLGSKGKVSISGTPALPLVCKRQFCRGKVAISGSPALPLICKRNLCKGKISI